MAEDDLRTLIEEALLDYDPELNLTAGSPAQTKIVDKIIAYVGEDPFDTNMEMFVKARLKQEFSQLGQENAAAIADLLIKPYRLLTEPVVREINVMKQRQSVRDINIHTEDSLDAILANIFMERETGDYARGTVRMFFDSPQYVAATSDVRFWDGEGHNFFPNGDQFISQRNMLLQQVGDEYYFDVILVAQSPGTQYNVDPGSIQYVEGIPGVKRVTNRFKFQAGLDRETNELFLTRAQNYPTEAALNAWRGILYVIQQSFPNVDQIQVKGYGDAEMQRDKLTGAGYGPIADSVIGAGLAVPLEDGDYDGLTNTISCSSLDFISTIGVQGAISDRALLTLAYADSLSVDHVEEHEIIEVVDSDVIKIDADLDIVTINALLVRLRSISLGDIPGGFMFPNQTEVKDGVHIGGAIDVYVKDKTPSEEEVNMEIVSDETYLVITDDAEITAGNREVILKDVDDIREEVHENTTGGCYCPGASDTITFIDIRPGPGAYYRIPQDLDPGDVVYFPTLNQHYTIISLDTSAYSGGGLTDGLKAVVNGMPAASPLAGYPYVIYKYTAGIKKGMVVRLTSGEPGTYRIFRASGWSDPGTHTEVGLALATSYEFTVTDTGIGAKVYDNVEVNLTEPKTIRIEDTDLKSIVGSNLVTSTTGRDFMALGVQQDDVLRILEGPNEGDYTVDAVLGAGWSTLRLEENIPFTLGAQKYQVFRLAEGVDPPLLNVTDMQLLDASLQPQGVEIPIGQPLASVTGDFTNMSQGVRYSTKQPIVGCFGRHEGTGYASVPTKDLRVRITFPNALTLIGVSDVVVEQQFTFGAGPFNTAQDVVDEINTNLSSLGVDYAVDIRGHVALRTTGNVQFEIISPIAPPVGDAAADIGWISDVTKSWGIQTPADPTNFGVTASSDYCYISTGVNGGTLSTITSIDTTNNVVYLDPTRIYLHPTNEDHVDIGFLSTGNVRFYFRDPTFFAVNQSTVLEVEDGDVTKSFIPDPTLSAQVFPVTSGDKGIAESISTAPDVVQIRNYDGYNELTESVYDDEGDGLVRCGDVVEFTHKRLWFDKDISGPGPVVPSPDSRVRISVGESVYKEVDLNSPPIASASDIVDRINDEFSGLASLLDFGGGATQYLVLDSEYEIKFEPTPNFLTDVGDPIGDPNRRDNRCDSYGTYKVLSMDSDDSVRVEALVGTLTVETNVVSGGDTTHPEPQVVLKRPGVQRICTTEMATQTENGHYYADMEFVSWGIGDQFNIPEDLYGELSGYKCWGYRLKNENSALAFSTEEVVIAEITSQVLERDVDCSPINERLIAGHPVRVSYVRSPVTEDVHTFISADTERVLCASVVGKHLIPAYVSGTINYDGQVNQTAAVENITELIEGISPEDRLEISDITNLLGNLGASYIQTPVLLAAFLQDENRKMMVRFVEDTRELGDLVTFFVDDINLVRLSS